MSALRQEMKQTTAGLDIRMYNIQRDMVTMPILRQDIRDMKIDIADMKQRNAELSAKVDSLCDMIQELKSMHKRD